MIKYFSSLYLLSLLLIQLLLSSAVLNAAEFSSGILPKTIIPSSESSGPTAITIFYPTKAPIHSIKMGPFSIEATSNAPLANNVRGLIVISHGLGGSQLGHRDVSVALAQEGFVVAAVLHSKDNYQYEADLNSPENWRSRPLEISAAITAVLNHTKFSEALADKPVGAFGFSRGGYTLLAALGARPNLQRLNVHCGINTHDPLCKRGLPPEGNLDAGVIGEIPVDLRICAAVLADPLVAIFSDDALKKIRDIPIEVYLPENENELLAQFNGGRLDALLNTTNRKHPVNTVKFSYAQHFSFLAPFPDEIKLPAEMRRQYDGFDRSTFVSKFHTQLVSFLKDTMEHCDVYE